MVLAHPLFSDTYVLAYDWAPDRVSWHLVRGGRLTAMDGSYVLAADRGADDRHLHPRRRHVAADDRAAAPQGGEDDRGRRAPRAQAPGRRLSATQAGRRPPAPPGPARLPERLSVGVDIGGTKVAAGVVDEAGRVLERSQVPTPSHDPKAVEDAIVDAVDRLRERHAIEAVGIGAAGWVDNTQSIVRFSPHLAWRDEPLRAALDRPHRPPAHRRQRRERGRLGRVPLRRRRRLVGDGLPHPGHRHRRRAGDQRRAVPGHVRDGRRVGPHDQGARTGTGASAATAAAGSSTPRATRSCARPGRCSARAAPVPTACGRRSASARRRSPDRT